MYFSKFENTFSEFWRCVAFFSYNAKDHSHNSIGFVNTSTLFMHIWRLYYKAKETEQISHLFTMGSTSTANNPWGHPEVITSYFKDLDQYFGIAKVRILPPRGRNYVVWPIFFLMNVFIALKGTHFWILFAFTAAGVVPCGGRKTSPRTSTIVQFIFYFWSFEISVNILRNQK